LNDIKTTLPPAQGPFKHEDVEEDETPVLPVQAKSGWFNYFSLESMGLAEYADNTSPSPLQYVTRFLPGLRSSPGSVEVEIFDQDEEEDKAEAERLFLNYSWWLLHEGWQEVANRVDDAVDRVFAKYVLFFH
jgi:peroxin-3